MPVYVLRFETGIPPPQLPEIEAPFLILFFI